MATIFPSKRKGHAMRVLTLIVALFALLAAVQTADARAGMGKSIGFVPKVNAPLSVTASKSFRTGGMPAYTSHSDSSAADVVGAVAEGVRIATIPYVCDHSVLWWTDGNCYLRRAFNGHPQVEGVMQNQEEEDAYRFQMRIILVVIVIVLFLFGGLGAVASFFD
jgi:flagellar basal body-associated protein FliL